MARASARCKGRAARDGLINPGSGEGFPEEGITELGFARPVRIIELSAKVTMRSV